MTAPQPVPERKQTGGGAFDPADRHIYFAAGDSEHYPRYTLLATNDLLSEAQERRLVALLDVGHQVLLDSGIFWLTNQHKRQTGVSMDEALRLAPEQIDGFEDLYDRYVELVRRHGDRLWGYIELDQGGRDNKIRTRARLEAAGLAPIPVYHPLVDGWDYFDELAEQYDRICFGNVVQAPAPVRLRLLHTLWERHRRYPDLWVHVLGLTVNEWCMALPPDSCDSSTWLGPLRWPDVRIDSALLRKVGVINRGFSYDLDQPAHPTRGRTACCQMCAQTVEATNTVWTLARTTREHLLQQGPYPPLNPKENTPA
ncbi:hypothetical protein LN042_18855 [Kitasatospora sp. RB6PN24]|uniref:hypothetical protein n=1 Tax=Kitasatospora humi TaxID=2893891 RepID=UPI001E4AEDAA|nr:hypothetical protein [Kitasatospora humi]MCC9309116.1 hypothetical protein [Kitasatospora humi]